MVSNTCSKIVDDRIDKQDRTISQMQEELQQVRFDFGTGMTGVLDRLDQLLFKITNMNATLEQQRQNPDVSAPSPVRDLNVGSTSFETAKGCDVKPLRIEVPRFNGIDPQIWIFKIQQYFDYHRVGEEERLKVAEQEHQDPVLDRIFAVPACAFRSIRVGGLSRQSGKTNANKVSLGVSGRI